LREDYGVSCIPPVISRNVSRHSEIFGIDLSDNGTVDVSAKCVNSYFSCEFRKFMRLNEAFMAR
jgi:hypothetical protein